LKPATGKDVCRILERNGWVLLRVSGSHHIYGKDGVAARITVPVHGNRGLKRGLQLAIMKQAALSDADL
jgi:predicted RNA binding protein YcfA (HicA-like mRNA interferase family)